MRKGYCIICKKYQPVKDTKTGYICKVCKHKHLIIVEKEL